MAPRTERRFLAVPRGYRSAEAALFVAELDDLTKQMKQELRGLTVRELEWQPAPGMNSIGMLLAHLAIVEAFWLLGPALGNADVDTRRVLGIGGDDDGIPAAPRAKHPEALRGKPLAFYLRLLARSRRAVRATAKTLGDRALRKPMSRFRRRARVREHYDPRWVLYHVLEHFAGHYGQILLLKHAMKSLPRRGRA